MRCHRKKKPLCLHKDEKVRKAATAVAGCKQRTTNIDVVQLVFCANGARRILHRPPDSNWKIVDDDAAVVCLPTERVFKRGARARRDSRRFYLLFIDGRNIPELQIFLANAKPHL